jgi:hypothetical protein
MTDPKLPHCPRCFSRAHVQPYSVGLVGVYPTTVEYECTWCHVIFIPMKPKISET